MTAQRAHPLAPGPDPKQQASSALLRALSKSEHYKDVDPTPGPGTAAQDLWAAFESIASQIEDNPHVVDKLANLVSAFALNATKASSPPAPATKAVAASSGSTDALGSGDTLQHIVELAKLVAPKAKQWAADRQKELSAERNDAQESRKSQEEFERKAVWWINDLAARTNPQTGVGLDAQHIEVVAMSLGVLLQATSITVRRTLQLESKDSAAKKVIGFSSGVALGIGLCAAGLLCPLTIVAAPFAFGVSAGAFIGASAATVGGASAAVGSVVGVVKSGIELDKRLKLEVSMSKVDITVRALVGYLCYLYNIETNAEAQNGKFFIKHLQELGLSQPVSKWNDPDFKCAFFKEAAHDLERDALKLSNSLSKMGMSVDPLMCT